MGHAGLSDVAFINGNMNSIMYQEVLESHLLPIAPVIGGENWTFQQDNASIHKSASTMQWLRDKNVEVLTWPARSPDLNPIENLWGILARKVYANGRQFDSKNQLKRAIESEWSKIDIETIHKLFESLPRRIFELLTARGGPTSY